MGHASDLQLLAQPFAIVDLHPRCPPRQLGDLASVEAKFGLASAGDELRRLHEHASVGSEVASMSVVNRLDQRPPPFPVR